MLVMSLLFLPTLVEAKLIFTEIMYDPAGTDTGHEWVEIYNDGSVVEDLSHVTFFEEGVNHKLKPIIGTSTLEAGQYGVIAEDPDKFRLDWPSYGSGPNPSPLFDSSFSLKNTGEPLALKRDGEELDFAQYDPALGGQGDGQSLQRESTSSWSARLATPGSGLASASSSSTPLSSTSPISTDVQPTDTISSTDIPQIIPGVSPVLSTAKVFPVEPQIFCKIKAQATALAGAEQIFSADVWGIKKEPITNARLIWNFGDGTTKEGRSVAHTFIQPGEYIIFLEISSGEYSATDRLTIKVVAPNFSLLFAPDYLEIQNHDSHEIDLYGLELRNGSGGFGVERFAFVPHTLISAHASLRLAFWNLVFSAQALLTLYYLNGSVIATSSTAQVVVVPVTTKSTPKKVVAKVAAKAPVKTVKKITQTASTASAVILSDISTSEATTSSEQPEALWKQYAVTALILVGLTLAGLYFLKSPIPLGK